MPGDYHHPERTHSISDTVNISLPTDIIGELNEKRLMNIKIIEPIGVSETAIESRLKDLLEKGSHRLFIRDTRGMTDAELIKIVSDADAPAFKRSNRGLHQA